MNMLFIILGLVLCLDQIWAAEAEWQNCETIDVNQFNPQIIWGDKKGDSKFEMYYKSTGIIKVIPDYTNAEKGERFDLQLVKYEQIKGERARNHFISLPGGPGTTNREVVTFLSWLQENKETAYYGIDYRGFMLFAQRRQQAEPRPDLETITDRGPFPIKDLTLENAARDVAMVIRAIQRSSEWMDGDKIILGGFSAGARWAHLVLSQYPDLVDVAFLGGIPPFGQFASSTTSNYDSLAEHCLLDDFCRKHLGDDLKTRFTQYLWKISNPNLNECTRIFHQGMGIHDLPKDPKKSMRPGKRLMRILRRLYYFASRNALHGMSFTTEQVGFLFVRAMHDCKNPSAFAEEVLAAVEPCLVERKGEEEVDRGVYSIVTSNGSSNVDLFLAQVLTVVSNTNPVIQWDLLRIKDNENEGISLIQTGFKRCKEWFKRLKKYVKGARYFEEKVVTTHKTRIYIFASKMDVLTPPWVAKNLYDKIESPQKVWILYDNLSHRNGYMSKEHFAILTSAIHGNPSAQEIESVVQEANAKSKLDWSLQENEKLRKLWDQIDSTASSAVVEKKDFLPTFLVTVNMNNNGMVSPPPQARWIMIRQHPKYKEKFGIKDVKGAHNNQVVF